MTDSAYPLDFQQTEDVRVDVRCSVMVTRGSMVLLLGRLSTPQHRDLRGGPREVVPGREVAPEVWVLPGGRPHAGESMAACARREAREETGLAVDVGRCQFVLEVADAQCGRTIDLVFAAQPVDPRQEPVQVEAGLMPTYVPLADLGQLQMRPPLAGYLRGLRPGHDRGAAYLGNLWRPDIPHDNNPSEE